MVTVSRGMRLEVAITFVTRWINSSDIIVGQPFQICSPGPAIGNQAPDGLHGRAHIRLLAKLSSVVKTEDGAVGRRCRHARDHLSALRFQS